MCFDPDWLDVVADAVFDAADVGAADDDDVNVDDLDGFSAADVAFHNAAATAADVADVFEAADATADADVAAAGAAVVSNVVGHDAGTDDASACSAGLTNNNVNLLAAGDMAGGTTCGGLSIADIERSINKVQI